MRFLTVSRVALVLVLGALCVANSTGPASSSPGGIPPGAWPYYKIYKTQPHFRAMACTGRHPRGGWACGRAWNQPSVERAIEVAMEQCQEARSSSVRHLKCQLQAIGDIEVSGMKKKELNVAIEYYKHNRHATNDDLAESRSFDPEKAREKPDTTEGIAGLSFRGITFTTGVRNAQPVDDLTSISLSEGSFYIHVRWALDLDLVKQFFVRYEVFDGQSKVASNASIFYAPESPYWNTWRRIKFSNSSEPGEWRVAIYAFVGPEQIKMVDTYLTVLPDQRRD